MFALCLPPLRSTICTSFFTQVFYVIEGAIVTVIHETQYIVATGGMFIVPRGRLRSLPARSPELKTH